MIPDTDLPDNPEEFAGLDVSFERLADDRAESCPIPASDILRYLEMELATEELPPEALRFIRTARVREKEYWVWELDEEYEDEDHYVIVWREPNGTTCTGYCENWWGLSLEQFLLAKYCKVI